MTRRQVTAPGPTPAARPVFLLGIFERSGTNYLWDLLRMHPDVGVRRPIWEDKLLHHAEGLVQYVDTVVAGWDPQWHVPSDERARLLRALGDGLLSFLLADATTPVVVLKTPSVQNLQLFHALFGDVPLIVLIRDGRDVTESAVRSFGWSYPVTMKQWSDAGRTVLDARRLLAEQGRALRVVRYEDLLADLRGEMTAVLDLCGLPVDAYDFDAAASAPVRGSSTVRPDDGGPVAWKRVERPDDFRPTDRFADWDPALRHLYAELAGDVATALGYEVGGLPPLERTDRMRLVTYRAELAAKQGQRSARHLSERVRRTAAGRFRR